MGRAEIAAVLAGGYLVAAFVWHRVHVWLRRRAGPPLVLLARFDYRVVWEELRESARGLAFTNDPAASSSGEFEAGEPEHVLAVAAAAHSVQTGKFDEAAACAARLPVELRRSMLATIELARAEQLVSTSQSASARQAAFAAFAHAEAASRRSEAGPGLEYLRAHLQLTWLTDASNLEWSAYRVLWKLGRAIKRWGPMPCMHFARAHAQALLGRHEEVLDELGRALYYSQGDLFYARPILEDPFVRQARPALFTQCKLLSERNAARATTQLSPDKTEG